MKALADILTESAVVVRETGQWILQQSSQFTSSDIIYKGTNDLVSFVDQQAEAKLKQGLSAIFPEAQFIAEETSSNYTEVGDGYYWVIDPLDGTTNFLHKLPIFAAVNNSSRLGS
jgi:myo-inositol-1(or 4)-monophosphatase